jgi:hypothetical protein
MNAQRYTLCRGEMIPNSTGDWVRYADVLALLDGAEVDLLTRILNHMRDDPFVAWRDTPIEKWAPCMLDLRIRWLSERGELMRELYTHTTPRGEA